MKDTNTEQNKSFGNSVSNTDNVIQTPFVEWISHGLNQNLEQLLNNEHEILSTSKGIKQEIYDLRLKINERNLEIQNLINELLKVNKYDVLNDKRSVVYEEREKTSMQDFNDYIAVKEDLIEIKTSINWIKWVIPILITIGIFITGLIVNSIKETTSLQYQKIENKLDAIKENNSMQIQRDVVIEVNKQIQQNKK